MPETRPADAARVAATAASLVLAALAVFAPTAARRATAAEGAVPFPVNRSRILRAEGTVYTVTGRQTIPAGVEVSCQKDVVIRGETKDATLVVAGSLQVHGVSSREVIFDGVVVEAAADSEDVHLDMCEFRGGGGVRSPKDQAVDGKLFLENVTFTTGAKLDVTMERGNLDLSAVTSKAPVRLSFRDPEGARRNSCRVTVRGSSLDGGLFIDNAADLTVRLSSMGGDLSRFTDNDVLTFDGNKVTSKTLSFVQTRNGRFGKTKLQKCDIYSTSLVARSPVGKKTSERISVDKCWFNDRTREKDLRTGLIKDGKDDPENAAVFRFKKINGRPLELGGSRQR